MSKILIADAQIGIHDNNSKFEMAPLMHCMDVYMKGVQTDSGEEVPQFLIKSYEVIERDNELLIYIKDENGNEFSVKSFSEDYLEYLNQLMCDVIELITQCKTKNVGCINTCRISQLSIVTKRKGEMVMVPPLQGLKLKATGNVSGHKYLKGNGSSSKIYNIDYHHQVLTSKRSVYEVVSISDDYEKFLTDTLTPSLIILEYYPA